MVGPEEFESSSIAPEATSLDQASRRPQSLIFVGLEGSYNNIGLALTLAVTKTNQKNNLKKKIRKTTKKIVVVYSKTPTTIRDRKTC